MKGLRETLDSKCTACLQAWMQLSIFECFHSSLICLQTQQSLELQRWIRKISVKTEPVFGRRRKNRDFYPQCSSAVISTSVHKENPCENHFPLVDFFHLWFLRCLNKYQTIILPPPCLAGLPRYFKECFKMVQDSHVTKKTFCLINPQNILRII